MPKTEDGYDVKENDLVWCVSDPFTITSITEIRVFAQEGEDEIGFTFWLDDGEDGGPFPVSNHEVFKYQRNCLLAARKKLYGDISSFHTSVKSHRKQIHLIDNFLHGEK